MNKVTQEALGAPCSLPMEGMPCQKSKNNLSKHLSWCRTWGQTQKD